MHFIWILAAICISLYSDSEQETHEKNTFFINKHPHPS